MNKEKRTITTSKEDITESNMALGAGAGIGAYGAWTFSAGALCPVCVIAVPALIGMGLWGRHKAKKKQKQEKNRSL